MVARILKFGKKFPFQLDNNPEHTSARSVRMVSKEMTESICLAKSETESPRKKISEAI